jgi:hypothetical protein
MSQAKNSIYMRHFIKKLSAKVSSKAALLQALNFTTDLNNLRTFYDFDTRYTAPLNGYHSAEEYWEKNSSDKILDKIKIPTLIISAKNDPFLSPSCYPIEAAINSKYLFLEITEEGGHMGFVTSIKELYKKSCWLEERALSFFTRPLLIS